MDYLTAKNQLICGDLSNTLWFKENNFNLEYAYSLLLEQKPTDALYILNEISETDIRADWLKKLIPIITENKIEQYPSFFQVRNFLEIDLSMLLQMKDKIYTLNLLNNCEFFYTISKESYKFMGRALYYHGFKELALKFFLFAKDKFYNDCELHFLLAKLYQDFNKQQECKEAIKTCLKFIPEYKPALKILKTFEKV